MNILCIIPAHNEEKTVAGVARGVRAMGYDLLVIDDGSTDQTVKAAISAGAQTISTGRKSGKGSALRLGFNYAVSKAYDAVITLDADGQHLPADIGPFIQCRKLTGAGIVNGNRMDNPQGMPWVRRVTNTFMSWIISMICRQHIPDSQCGFRLVAVGVLKDIALESSDFEIETEILIKASKKGFKIASVPIVSVYRDEVSKIRPLRDTKRFLKYIMKELSSP